MDADVLQGTSDLGRRQMRPDLGRRLRTRRDSGVPWRVSYRLPAGRLLLQLLAAVTTAGPLVRAHSDVVEPLPISAHTLSPPEG